MRNYILLSLLIACNNSSFSQTWQWATSAGGSNGELVISSCVDVDNNLYFSGGFSVSAYFGNDTLSSQSNGSTFVSKMDHTGNIVWAIRAEGYETTNGYGPRSEVFYDSYDNSLFVSSRMSGPNQSIGDCPVAQGQPGTFNYYLTKLDVDGNCVWTLSFGDEFILNLVADGIGHLYAIMWVVPGGSMFEGEFLSEGRYLLKVNSDDGSVLWNQRILDFGYGLPGLAYQDGKLWIADNTGSGTNFWFAGSTETTFSNDIFVAQLDTTGTVQWVNTYGGEDLDYVEHLGVDLNGNSYVSGVFENEAFFGDTSITTTNANDVFLMKLDSEGQRVWLKQANAENYLDYYCGVSDSAGNSALCGKFAGTVTVGAHTVTSTDEKGIVIAYDSSGVCTGIKTISNIGDGLVIPAIDHAGNTLVTGSFNAESSFDGIALNSVDGSMDVFVAKIDFTTSIPEYRVDSSNELFIYANPNLGKCTIDVPDDFLYENNLVLRIFDASGKLIRQTPLVMNQGRIQLSLEQEAKGIYTATLSNSEKTYHGRIVFE